MAMLRNRLQTKEEYREWVDELAREALTLARDEDSCDHEQDMHDWLTEITFVHDDSAPMSWANTLFNSDHPDNRTQPPYYAADFTLRADVRRRMDEIDPLWRAAWEYRGTD